MPRNSINGTHDITPNNWVVSILRPKDANQCFIIIEGMNEQQQRITLRAELGNKMIGQREEQKEYDKTKAQIYLEPASYQWLQEQAAKRAYYCRNFEIEPEEKNKLIAKIEADMKKDIDYVVLDSNTHDEPDNMWQNMDLFPQKCLYRL